MYFMPGLYSEDRETAAARAHAVNQEYPNNMPKGSRCKTPTSPAKVPLITELQKNWMRTKLR